MFLYQSNLLITYVPVSDTLIPSLCNWDFDKWKDPSLQHDNRNDDEH
ncbi:hypothetical protein SLEP1_g34201 [Rubroshorea leprosula]|uniref:Uncharacterized protein n=1 Tax=Rubroshorea leprosula TaxID=152421 RepID=A0AAV5KJ27_9ROSI|nr:hypothetical protein SLEP1_g34201 [Rubroshorea leprosula]